jgi:hypothetical protein
VTLTLVPEDTADPISVVQAESLKSLTVFPLTTPLTLIVGVGLEPGEPCGVTKDNDDGAEGAVVTAIPLLELCILAVSLFNFSKISRLTSTS